MVNAPRIDNIESSIGDVKPNIIINGNFDFWQRGTSAISTNDYLADRFEMNHSSAGTLEMSQSSDVPAFVDSGFNSTYSLNFSPSVIDASMDTADIARFRQKIEGYNITQILGKQAIFSFWVKSNKTGIYSASFSDSTNTRRWVSEFEITSADTWQFISISVNFNNANSAGTWDYTNGIGLYVTITLMGGSSYQTSTLDQWATDSLTVSSNQVNFMDNTSNYFRIAQVQLVESETFNYFRRAGRDIQDELAKCQRYFEKSYRIDIDPGTSSDTGFVIGGQATSGAYFIANTYSFKVRKRTNTTNVFYDRVGNAGKVSSYNMSSWSRTDNLGFNTQPASDSSIQCRDSGSTVVLAFHFTADAEL